jgi:superoxide dismutase, Fe-Mn family
MFRDIFPNLMMTRRDALKRTGLATAAVAVTGTIAAPAQPVLPASPRQIFTLPSLPYALDALEPHLDARTMEIHHDKHHAAYVTNLNKALSEFPDFTASIRAETGLETLLKELNAVPEKIRTAVRNNGGGHYNHSLFWQMLSKGGGQAPTGDLARGLEKAFGSFDGFKTELTKAALGQFGSGWAWLTLDGGALRIAGTPNQDSPITSGRPVLLGIDVWEHAYYLKYQNRRADYIAAWFNVVNWEFVAERFRQFRG